MLFALSELGWYIERSTGSAGYFALRVCVGRQSKQEEPVFRQGFGGGDFAECGTRLIAPEEHVTVAREKRDQLVWRAAEALQTHSSVDLDVAVRSLGRHGPACSR